LATATAARGRPCRGRAAVLVLFFLCRFTWSLSFSFPVTVFARFLLLCASSHAVSFDFDSVTFAVSFDFDSVTVDGRKIGAEAILALINK
jgi:hypothetical protein